MIALAESNLDEDRKSKGEKAKLTIETRKVEYGGKEVQASILTALSIIIYIDD